jgi:DNA polymerase elongation subunit (family B)
VKFYTSVAQVKGKILVRGYDDHGKQVRETIRYRPSFFVENEDCDSDYRTLDGRKVMRIEKSSIYDANQYLKENSNVSNKTIYGYDQYAYTYINERFNGVIDYDPSFIRIANIDIETASDEGMPDIETANKEITAITVMYGKDVLSMGCRDYTPTDPDVTYIKCDTEEEMLEKFLQSWEWYNPDVVTGWYIENFDIPYIVNRLKLLLGDKAALRLSPWGHLREKIILDRGKMRRLYFPTGIALLDYLKIYKKMELEPRESYSLNFIASTEVGAKKLDYSEYESLFSLYKENFPKFMDYNILDVRLVDKIEQKKQMLQLTFQMAYTAHCNFEDINSPVRMWEAICYNDLMDRNVVFPPRQNITGPSFKDDADGNEIMEELEGGYVKDPIPGLYKWVASVDLTSSYPHQIIQYNISPETFRGKRDIEYGIEHFLNELPDPQYDYIIKNELVSAANGCLYDRTVEGFLPRLLGQWFNARVEFKAKVIEAKKLREVTTDPKILKVLDDKIANYNNKQMVYKVALNSAYGALSNKWFRFYNFDNADSVTSCGRLAIRWIEKKLNEYMNGIMFTNNIDYVIASDTDSIYLNFGPLIEKKYGKDIDEKTPIINLLDMTIRNKIEPYIEDCYRELQKKVNSTAQKMQMNRESIADVAIWTGKKRYIMNIWDKEGVRYTVPKLEIKGIDSVRSSTPPSCREAIKSLIKIIIFKTEEAAQEFIETFKNDFQKLPFDEIAFPRGINGMEEYFDEAFLCKKGTPVQVRGALVYNHMLEEKGIHNFQPLYDGDKAKFCYLITPNSVRSYVIAVPHAIPKIFNLDDKIDRAKQFEIGFLSPVIKIFDAIGWRTEPEGNTLDDFMAGKLNG